MNINKALSALLKENNCGINDIERILTEKKDYYSLGILYYFGDKESGFNIDYNKAFINFHKSILINSGNYGGIRNEAWIFLGQCFLHSLGVRQDILLAFHYFFKAFEAFQHDKNLLAMINLNISKCYQKLQEKDYIDYSSRVDYFYSLSGTLDSENEIKNIKKEKKYAKTNTNLFSERYSDIDNPILKAFNKWGENPSEILPKGFYFVSDSINEITLKKEFDLKISDKNALWIAADDNDNALIMPNLLVLNKKNYQRFGIYEFDINNLSATIKAKVLKLCVAENRRIIQIRGKLEFY